MLFSPSAIEHILLTRLPHRYGITLPTILCNNEGGTYTVSHSFAPNKWYQISKCYSTILWNNGRCTVRKLASAARISKASAGKAIDAFYNGFGVPQRKKRGHGKRGAGSMNGITMEHHAFLYELYLDNPARPLDGYS